MFLSTDPKVLEELVPFRKEIDAIANKEVGKTMVFLDGNRLSCRMVECNLGNLIADAYIHLVKLHFQIVLLAVPIVGNLPFESLKLQ